MMTNRPKNISISRILIANRGEIAVRVIKTARILGIETIAVYSEADKDAMHVHMADQAVFIGPADAAESYLRADKIIQAAKEYKADAIHPGYGFLSENPDFADALALENIIFIGPSAYSMKAMALKGAAKNLMETRGVPVVPGYHGDDQSIETLAKEADRIGYPVLIKAVAGGGGKGMRRVDAKQDFTEAVEAAAREGQKSFGNPKVLIEKFLVKPRHIEFQIFGDALGNIVYLWERDCSVQRRHQKVLEEAPAPGMTPDLRRKMGQAAVRAAKTINYSGAGTVEFIVDVEKGLENAPFYFMEMNTRLQVEHPVTEAITGQDLVAWQILVAEGKPLPLTQSEIDHSIQGHAFEARLYAEDTTTGFLPQTGTITHFNPFMDLAKGERIDTGVAAGDSVGIHYDPMIAKVITWGATRELALKRLLTLLGKIHVGGLITNRDFLIQAAGQDAFRQGDFATDFINLHEKDLLTAPEVSLQDLTCAVAGILASRSLGDFAEKASKTRISPWTVADGFKVNLHPVQTLALIRGDTCFDIIFTHTQSNFTVTYKGKTVTAEFTYDPSGNLIIVQDGRRLVREIRVTKTNILIFGPTKTLFFERSDPAPENAEEPDGPGMITAPMPGKILKIFIRENDFVEKGASLLVMEAMKMEQTLTAPRAGTIARLGVKQHDQIEGGAFLISIEE